MNEADKKEYKQLCQKQLRGDPLTSEQQERFRLLEKIEKIEGINETPEYLVKRLVETIRLIIGAEIDEQLKCKMASTNLGVVEELNDKLNYLLAQNGWRAPTAAQLAIAKDKERKRREKANAEQADRPQLEVGDNDDDPPPKPSNIVRVQLNKDETDLEILHKMEDAGLEIPFVRFNPFQEKWWMDVANINKCNRVEFARPNDDVIEVKLFRTGGKPA